MKKQYHWAILGAGLSMESPFISTLLNGKAEAPFDILKGKNGVLFSSYTLNQFIKEEALHDDYTLSHENRRSIRTFSSGEQKKALLKHLLSKNPDFIILDNAFDMLDKASQIDLQAKLKALSETIHIIQVFRRRDNILPFIDSVWHLENDKIVYSGTRIEYLQRHSTPSPFFVDANIPTPLVQAEINTDTLIHFRNVSVDYGDRHILKEINWKIKPGDFWQLRGPNGSGKTTLLTMITGDNPKAYGQDIELFGKKKGSGESIWDIKKKMGYITPAMTVLFKGRHTVESMVISGLYDSIGLYKKATHLEQKLANQWINLIGLSEYKQRPFAELSEGQQCMVLIARSMIKHPPLLILDEPTHGLDDKNAAILCTLTNKIAKESQTTIIYVSHKEEEHLHPTRIFELTPGKSGSRGEIIKGQE